MRTWTRENVILPDSVEETCVLTVFGVNGSEYFLAWSLFYGSMVVLHSSTPLIPGSFE